MKLRGRPKKKNTITIGVSVAPELIEQLDDTFINKEPDKIYSRSAVIAQAIEALLVKEKQGETCTGKP